MLSLNVNKLYTSFIALSFEFFQIGWKTIVSQVLEELGILSRIKRVAGTSAGSISAVGVAIGLTVQEAIDFMGKNFGTLIQGI